MQVTKRNKILFVYIYINLLLLSNPILTEMASMFYKVYAVVFVIIKNIFSCVIKN
jgi:hypothetical protein